MVEAINSGFLKPVANNKASWVFVLLITLILTASAQKLKVGKEAPVFTCRSLADSVLVDLQSYRGKVVLVDFWASWCSPCIENNEELVSVYLKYKNKGFEILAVSFDEDKNRLLKHLAKYNYPWQVQLWEPQGFNSEIANRFKVNGLPTSYLIDQNGLIVWLDPDAYDVEIELKRIFRE